MNGTGVTSRLRGAARGLLALLGGLVATVIGWLLFVRTPSDVADLAGVLLAVVTAVAGVQAAGRLGDALLPGYQVAEVAVEGPITRDTGGLPTGPTTADADAIVDQIERADADRGADGLLVRLNTPGGEVVPSDDVRRAVEAFDGPTVAYATDTCASGGYWIASGCDSIWARDASLVGSIGVLGSRLNASDLADRLGVDYERFAAGAYKDAGLPLKEPDEDDRDYLQGLTDDIYDRFLDRVTDGRDLDRDAVRETEARVYVGEGALDAGLVDAIGTREDAADALAERLGRETVAVREFEPPLGVRGRLTAGIRGVAHAFGAGVGRTVGGRGEERVRFRV
jgi:protease-4